MIEVSWLVPNQVIYVKCPRSIGFGEIEKLSHDLLALLDGCDGSAHILFDMLETVEHPLNPVEILKVTQWLGHPKLNWLLLMTTNKLSKMIASIMLQKYLTRYRIVESYEEGVGFLKSVDGAVPL